MNYIIVQAPGLFSENRSSLLLKFLLVFIFITQGHLVSAQEKVVTLGIQFKPIFSSKFFNTGPENTVVEGIDFEMAPQSGFCFGMVIRKGISNTVSIESGINYVKRNYEINVTDPDSNFTTTGDFGMVGYEIPIEGLVFIQLSDRIYMDVALGLSLDFYPSDIQTTGDHFQHYSARNSWFSPALLGNIGWEYRTEKSGYIYLGASYHRPFSFTYTSKIQYDNRELPYPNTSMELLGNYLTFDIRYFFHSDPEKQKKKTRKPNPKTK